MQNNQPIQTNNIRASDRSSSCLLKMHSNTEMAAAVWAAAAAATKRQRRNGSFQNLHERMGRTPRGGRRATPHHFTLRTRKSRGQTVQSMAPQNSSCCTTASIKCCGTMSGWSLHRCSVWGLMTSSINGIQRCVSHNRPILQCKTCA